MWVRAQNGSFWLAFSQADAEVIKREPVDRLARLIPNTKCAGWIEPPSVPGAHPVADPDGNVHYASNPEAAYWARMGRPDLMIN